MPMAMAGFDSIGQKPEPVKAVCLDPFFAFVLAMVRGFHRGRGRREAGNKKEDFTASSAERININAPVS